MNNYITKYLAVKMYLGYGYSATQDEIDESIDFLKQKGIEVDGSYDENFIVKKQDTYHASYKLNSNIMNLNDVDNYALISEYIMTKTKPTIVEEANVDSELIDRSKNLVIYLIIALNYIEQVSGLLEELVSDSDINSKYVGIFKRLFPLIAKLLSLGISGRVGDDEDLKIITLDSSGTIPSYKAYCNYLMIDRELDGILSNNFKEGYAFAMAFGTDEYYGLPSCKNDLFFATHGADIYGPIYICRSNSPDMENQKKGNEERAKELIKKHIGE